MRKRQFLQTAAAALLATSALTSAHAQATPLKFQLDWRFEGPAALFVHPEQKGYFKDVGLDVNVEAASGAGAIQRVASGTHDLGFADLAALMEFHANNPDAPIKPVAIMVIYNTTPASVMALKKSGITKAADLTGKKLGAPIFDAGRRTFPLFAQANGVGEVQWTTMDPPLRETMLVRGDLDAVTGYTFTSLLNLEARGVKREDVVVLPYATHGVQLYGNVIIASPKLIAEKPEAVRAFLKAFAKGAKEGIAHPEAAIASMKAKDGLVNVPQEVKRLKLTIETAIDSEGARKEGFGQLNPARLQLMAEQVGKAYATKRPIPVQAVWNGSFLPSAAELDVLPKR
ncbi:ABC transporter substrate-binding protein [Comamonas aquatica]|jgi:NitT/TauT family transport system substrate-binding protein|uniref:Thiamine pyrimidine synthase n=1 Tax=Comamonas aquatica TaxID=225991 RepID=A0AA35D6E0_9BURK|nr:ABC transporter substrate-binding protein [Comamonas aquatica]CAB5670403.1 ABC-type taurine transport system, periplasmic component [Comamonas aquatica]CAB5681559.1 ABC-type taurine transport system, periplasmic component [Comamonas aquatica]CAC9203655.1 ABC-type taurine transport system, periplasmic component [Comamonas aquatica]CAC9688083.1 ABC-type taurine transport system, periplasmic component [Comamonas aquatica]